MERKAYMEMAIKEARKGVRNGQTPFGACIVKDNEIISCSCNSVWDDMDITAHAEINAIREACRRQGTIDLSGCVIYSTCEPCPMCFSACSWARISRIVFGARIEDAQRFGFSELPISNETMRSLGKVNIEVVPDFMRDECIKLFKEWSQRDDRRSY
jgi:tRNA(Arg) A34 adenosine deaminase TadA